MKTRVFEVHVSGAAGTGKSILMAHIKRALEDMDACVAMPGGDVTHAPTDPLKPPDLWPPKTPVVVILTESNEP